MHVALPVTLIAQIISQKDTCRFPYEVCPTAWKSVPACEESKHSFQCTVDIAPCHERVLPSYIHITKKARDLLLAKCDAPDVSSLQILYLNIPDVRTCEVEFCCLSTPLG